MVCRKAFFQRQEIQEKILLILFVHCIQQVSGLTGCGTKGPDGIKKAKRKGN